MKNLEETYLIDLIIKAKSDHFSTADSPKEYIKINYNDLLDVQTIEYIYRNICQISMESSVNSDRLIKLLIRRYIMFNYNESNPLIKYLNYTSPEEVLTFFRENEYFAIELIINYFAYLDRKPSDKYGPWYGLCNKFDDSVTYTFLADMLRSSFGRFYDLMEMVGRGMNIPAGQVFLMTINEQLTFSGDKTVSEDFVKLKGAFPYLIKLMYADVYEDLVASGLINNSGKKIVQMVKSAIESGEYVIPTSTFDANLLFGHFAYLAKQKDKRIDNRRAQTKESIENIRKINPLWALDDSEIIKR